MIRNDMRCNYIPETMDLEIFLDLRGSEILSPSLECELTYWGRPLKKKLRMKQEDFGHHGDGIIVNYLKTDPNGGWNETYAIEVLCNSRAIDHLVIHRQVSSRHGGAFVTINAE